MENFFYKFLFKLFTNIFMFSFFYLSINFSSFYAQQVSEEDRTGRIAKQFLNESILRQIDGGGNTPAAIQERFFTGQAAGDQFGYSVASAGDVNGDGYDDIIVGAPYYDGTNTNCGRAYIFWGGQIINNIPDVILKGEQGLNHYFGTSVAGAGDLNGDGYADIVVGAPGTDYRGTDAGTFYIYLGGDPMSLTHHRYLDGSYAGDQLGISVSSAGDVNGDGYSDLIVGAFLYDVGTSIDAGIAYIFYGGATINIVADVTLTGAAANDNFGYSVASAGDVNGDGYSDAIVGAYGNDFSGVDAGRAYIYYGGSPMNTTADVSLNGAAAADNFGYSVSTAGDVNGDGYSDVIVGAWLNDYSGSNAGRAYTYFGGSVMNNVIDVYLNGSAAGDGFGRSVSTAGDVNGDGYSDMIVGAIWNDVGGFDAGRAYIYFGGASAYNIADIILTGTSTDNFGVAVSAAGDVNGDGYSDVIIGANGNDAVGTDAGRVYLFTNSLVGTDIPDEFFTVASAGDRLGYSVSGAGDLNGDGYEDMIVGAYNNDDSGVDAGRAYIYFGGVDMTNTADLIINGVAAGDNFGKSVSSAGDVNGDGYSDVIIGAPSNDDGGNNAGSAYIYFGGASMDILADKTLTGEGAEHQFGFSVSSAGDANGDGYSDVIVGSPINIDGTYAGKAFIYFGGAIMDNSADVTLTVAIAGNYFGWSVSTAGDVNGDGFSDVIVGTGDGISPGKVNIYYGGVNMNSVADITMTGASTGDLFGRSVSSAGDVNRDGYSDVIIGAPFNDAGGTNAGRAYIYFGGTTMNNNVDITLTGEAMGDEFGYSVSTSGDVNNDGYSDVIIGARFNDAGGTDAGRAYTYFGNTIMDTTLDVIMTGVSVNDQFGLSVSNSGDVNGDGYSDVIVGAYLNDAGGVDAGRAYLYLSSAPPAKPRIMSVKDVPNDQGGKVRVQWTRSSYDIHGTGRLSEYIVQRSNPPGQTGFIWDYVETIPAIRQPFYSYIAPTLSDSTTNSTGTFFFRIIARGTNLDELWLSSPVSGHSVDNLSPTEVVGFTASVLASDNKLSWKENTETDLKNYYIYRSFSSTIDPDVTTPILITSDTTQLDTSVPPGDSYYFIRAKDIHDNFGPLTEISSPLGLRQITFTALLEGFYSSGSSTMVEDTVTLLLKSISPPYTTMDQAVVQLSSIGAGLPKFRQAANGTSYYLVIKHRNSIETWTKVGQQFINSEMIYDFTTAAGQAYGDNMKQKGTEWCIYGGEIANGDQYIDGDDVTSAFNAQGLSGYVIQDVTGDDYVDGDDVTLIFNNQGAGAITPTILKNIKAVDIKHIKLKNESEKKVERNID